MALPIDNEAGLQDENNSLAPGGERPLINTVGAQVEVPLDVNSHAAIEAGQRFEPKNSIHGGTRSAARDTHNVEENGVSLRVGKNEVSRPSSVEEEASASDLKLVKDNKRAFTSEDSKLKTRMARKPRKNTIPLTVESVLRLRDDDEEEEENDGSVLVSRMKKTIDDPKAAESMVIYRAPPQTEELSEEGSEANISISQLQQKLETIGQLREEVVIIRAETMGWKDGMDRLATEKETVRAQLSSNASQLQGMKEKSLVQARRIEELEARLSSELAKAKSDAEKAKSYMDALVAVYRADAEAAQVQAREAAETANTRAHWVVELAKCQSRRETLEEIHTQGFDLTEEIKRAKELEADAEALASVMMMVMMMMMMIMMAMMRAIVGPRAGRSLTEKRLPP
ncbi:uncharacterized protein [Nicotiana tomentosiformis]|uniref:uncharacterized protein n=1 Tax=Nicotiana tomentosiformis TaxID=4098 RepID=UPI00388C5EA5